MAVLSPDQENKQDLTTKDQVFRFARSYKEGSDMSRKTNHASAELLIRENDEGIRQDPEDVVIFLKFISEHILLDERPELESRLLIQATLAAVEE